MEKIFPDIVSYEENTYGIRYSSLIPYLVQTIKELDAKNLILENRIAKLESKQGIDGNGLQTTEEIVLYQNNPNPFSNSTEISMYVSASVSSVSIFIYDLKGTCLFSGLLSGDDVCQLNVSFLNAGIYLVNILGETYKIIKN